MAWDARASFKQRKLLSQRNIIIQLPSEPIFEYLLYVNSVAEIITVNGDSLKQNGENEIQTQIQEITYRDGYQTQHNKRP